MSSPTQLIVEFTLDELRLAFAVADVQRVIRAVAVTSVPGAPACLVGVIDVHGGIVPVFDTRVLLGRPAKPLEPGDHIIICNGTRPRAFIADRVMGSFVAEPAERPRSFMAGASPWRGIVRRGDGMLLVHDMKQFMALDDALPLAVAHG